MGRKATSLDKLFEKSMPIPFCGCWIWMGGLARDGRYGSCSYLDHIYRTHRLSYFLAYGQIPDGVNVLHKCDIPLCINPDHLFLGTDADNMLDKTEKNRQAKGRDCNHPYNVFSENTVKEARTLYGFGFTLQEVADEYGCTKSTVSMIVNRKTWRHVL